jgi:hypothetical protein
MVLTAKLNNQIFRNSTFVAKKTQFGTHAIGYANLTQAKKAQSKLAEMGVETEIITRFRPFYLMIK